MKGVMGDGGHGGHRAFHTGAILPGWKCTFLKGEFKTARDVVRTNWLGGVLG